MIGKTLNHFKFLDHLGKGGMGEVYVAEDCKLKRKVALKVLPEEVARDPARLERFQREAETIAALNHPNIVTIYSIEEADGIRFLTMELVEGETLIQLIPSNGMDVESFLRFSTPVAEALSAAHEKGIIHRDLKPGNIMVSQEGRIKVLDFGLAKLMRNDSDPDSSRLETYAQTQDGIVLGTMPYMSPEQIQGKRLDQRSDIFSLGIIFYEMITGRRPFHGDTSADLISSIMRDTPDPVGELKAGTPEHLERIIRHCLMKDPRDRYQTARDVYNELRDLNSTSGPSKRAASSATSGEMWIAVLPFQHPAADPEIESFADGLVQDITAALSQFSYLSVIARDSNERLKARYVIQGGIRKSGTLIRVNVQLIDTRTGTNLWAETYNRDLKSSDIFTIQDEITDRVAATLADQFGVLVRSMVASLEEKRDDQLSGNEFVFRFFGYWTKLTPEEHAKIRRTLERAVERTPRNSDIWGCLSLVYYHEFAFGFNELPNSLDRCLMAAQRAVELNRVSQLAYEALTWAQFFRRDVGALPATVERAISLNPRNSHMLAVAGLVLVHTRNFDRGATVARRAMELNPHHAGWFHFSLIWDHYSRGEYDQALEQAKRVNMPGFFWPPLVIASVCGELGRKAEAASAVNELLAIDPEFAVHARRYIEPWHYASGFLEPLLEGLHKAGLEVITDHNSRGCSDKTKEPR
jgi:eukaryotic-like serine/threonine-protein kinase